MRSKRLEERLGATSNEEPTSSMHVARRLTVIFAATRDFKIVDERSRVVRGLDGPALASGLPSAGARQKLCGELETRRESFASAR